ncbi:B12-binding domain-containing radical SAM protein [Methanobrevibacter sp. TMH8]|uniref:B12-binding domain-containing radical SAM protein n=1 Tax=Methanobrevibacter sp. TMH8 TaxID=2848611 RepID=UPI001CCB2976|nr:radical SAM protein [Methanobrevibacter sp. TMH8]MBZ9570980.1 B12-binding domain-containing radical SAM protein [Methanobrevibacter sp. TMH8]
MSNYDVLLINPIDNTAVKNGLGLNVPPLNLMYLGGMLEENSFSVKILDDDLYQEGSEKISNIVSKIDPLVVGVTATTATIKESLKYIRAVKEKLPNALTVIGGPHSTFLPVETLNEEPNLDVVVIGEGEETLVEVADKYSIYENIENFSDIKGIVYRDRISSGRIDSAAIDSNNVDIDRISSDGIYKGRNHNEGFHGEQIKINEPRPLIKDLDSLPFPARHLIPFKSYKLSNQAGGMITSRGCPYSCNYCSSSLIMGKKFRTRSPDNVVDELEVLVDKYGLKDVAFLDDIFMLNKKRAKLIADEIKRRNIDVSFVASSRVNTVDKSLLESLKNVGMKTLYCGVESGSQRVLDLMKKGITLQQARDAFKTAKEVGVDVIGSFILGYPGETSKEMDETINFSIELDPDYSQYSILTPFPGTPIHSQLNDGNLLSTNGWDDYTVLKSVINYEKLGLSKSFVERKLAKAYIKFYTRPKYLIKHRNMFKVLLQTIHRSFIRPIFRQETPKGWYNALKEE